MKLEELRIGNKVKCKISNDAGIYTVLGIPAWGFDGMGDGFEPLVLIDRCPKQLVAESKLKGVPLTEEILLKCWFEYRDKPDTYTRNGLELYGSPVDDGWFIESIAGVSFPVEKCREIRVKYLHQLQNLYFALTGEELTINL